MARRGGATYDLADVQALIRRGVYRITNPAFDGAAALSWDRSDIVACVLALDESDFYKTMTSIQIPGLMQDVYRPRYLGVELYVKVQLSPERNTAVIISFKEA